MEYKFTVEQAITILRQIKEISEEEALTEFVEIAKVKGIDGALNDIADMEKRDYLKQHHYEIYYSEHDRRYRTYLPLVNGKRKAITSVSKENLENKIVAFYRQGEEPQKNRYV